MLLVGYAAATSNDNSMEADHFDFFAVMGDIGSKLQFLSLDKSQQSTHEHSRPEANEMLFLRERRTIDPLELNGKEMEEAMAQAFTTKKEEEQPSAADLQGGNLQEEEVTSLTTEWKKMREEADKIEKEK